MAIEHFGCTPGGPSHNAVKEMFVDNGPVARSSAFANGTGHQGPNVGLKLTAEQVARGIVERENAQRQAGVHLVWRVKTGV
jgi:hypothetical protein